MSSFERLHRSGEHGWRHAVQRTVRTFLVVVDPPVFNDSPCIRDVGEPVFIETLVTKLAVETLDEGILNRLSRSNEVQRDAILLGPEP